MSDSRDPETRKLIQASREAVAVTRHIIARSVRARQDIRAIIRETRRLIDATRADQAGRLKI